MLSTSSLLNLNVDTLFEQHGVADITLVNKKIQEVIEEKKEELRTMVGERYRDLLKAADTITAMQNSSQTLISQVDRIGSFCKSLNDGQLLGFKVETDSTTEFRKNKANSKKVNYFSTIIQIKMLTSLPELIWSHLDKEEYFAATELFIFSRHISAGLQLDADNVVLQKLPVARKQWEMLKPFYSTIRLQVLTVLQRPQLTTDITVDCLLALLQLERCTLEKALTTFLQLRCTAFQNSIIEEKSSEPVNDRIIASLRILYDTLELVAHCFLENGLLFTRLKELLDDGRATVLNRLSSDEVEFMDLLPEIIINFKPNFEDINLSQDAKVDALKQWLNCVQNTVDKHFKQLFDGVMDLQTLHNIKTVANDMGKEFHGGIFVMRVGKLFGSTNSIDFYVQYYLPLINQRIHELIAKYWSDMIDELYRNVTQIFESLTSEVRYDDIWSEHLKDLPDSLAIAMSSDIVSKQLLMRSKGYNALILEICTVFDKQIQRVMNEIEVLLDDQCTRVEEKQTLSEGLRERAQSCLIEFANRIKQFSETLQSKKSLVILANCCCAILEICPSLRSCLGNSEVYNNLKNVTLVTKQFNSNAQQVFEVFTEVVHHIWMRIIDEIFDDCNKANYLPKTVSYDLLLRNFTNWELITLEENSDHDEDPLRKTEMRSSFRVPTQPSISLQTYLHKAVEMLNDTVCQTLPSEILEAFNDKLLENLNNHYNLMLKEGSEEKLYALQNTSLQIYFDITFLQNMFTFSRERKESFNTLRNLCRDNIDPFDFELWSSHLLNNAKIVVNRYMALFGVLTPLINQISISVGNVSTGSDKDPNVLSLCSSSSTTLWFPLLPVVADSAKAEEQKIEKPSTKTVTMQSTVAEKSPAARKTDTKTKSMSFFGSMSQEWFR